ncbi:hypothetical protein LTR97_008319 [Elasticomyces elasticus]|uniref:Uncharacterized protein n=1 Tax=Elasticomyces elasticus TaxID=574655 RepID=A0AAN8A1Q3_9PEZI|nr:hypothetical protein LTR97_008319 [Elasticomyces elasticus]
MADSSDSAVSPTPDVGSAPPIVQTSKLLTIAAELRNTIYELVFTKPPGPTNLLTATPPSSDILSVCKQTRREAHGLWVTANRDYWPNTTFTITKKAIPPHQLQTPLHLSLTPQDLSRIRTILFTARVVHFDNLRKLFTRHSIASQNDHLVTFEHDVGTKGQWRLTVLDGGDFKDSGAAVYMRDLPMFVDFRLIRMNSEGKPLGWVPHTDPVTVKNLSSLMGREVVLAEVKEELRRSDGMATWAAWQINRVRKVTMAASD